MRNIPYWLNIGSILHQYGCATRAITAASYRSDWHWFIGKLMLEDHLKCNMTIYLEILEKFGSNKSSVKCPEIYWTAFCVVQFAIPTGLIYVPNWIDLFEGQS